MSFGFNAEGQSTVWTDHASFTHSPDNRHLGSFRLWTSVNDAVVNAGEQVILLDPGFNSVGGALKIAGSYRNSTSEG